MGEVKVHLAKEVFSVQDKLHVGYGYVVGILLRVGYGASKKRCKK